MLGTVLAVWKSSGSFELCLIDICWLLVIVQIKLISSPFSTMGCVISLSNYSQTTLTMLWEDIFIISKRTKKQKTKTEVNLLNQHHRESRILFPLPGCKSRTRLVCYLGCLSLTGDGKEYKTIFLGLLKSGFQKKKWHVFRFLYSTNSSKGTHKTRLIMFGYWMAVKQSKDKSKTEYAFLCRKSVDDVSSSCKSSSLIKYPDVFLKLKYCLYWCQMRYCQTDMFS